MSSNYVKDTKKNNLSKYLNHAITLHAYKHDEPIRKGSGTALRFKSTPKEKCMLVTNFHLLLNNNIRADKFVIRSICPGADGRIMKYKNVIGFDILKDILIFSFKCTIDCPILTIRKTKLRNKENIFIPIHRKNGSELKNVSYKRNKFILHRNVILIEADGKAGEGISGSPAIDRSGNFIGIVAGGIKGINGNKSVFIIPEEDIKNTYRGDYYTDEKEKVFMGFIDAYRAFLNKDHSNAILNYERYIKSFPDDAKAHYHLGNVYHYQGMTKGEIDNYRKAMVCYDRALELLPVYTQAIFNKGNIYYDLNRHKDAIECYNRVLKIAPYYIKVYINRGNEYVKTNQYSRALKEYTKAIQMDDTYPEAYNNRGNAYMEMGKLENAFKDYRKALELDLFDPDTIFNMGTYYYHNRKHKKALQYYNRAIKIKPGFIEYYIGRADLFTELKLFDKAIYDYTRSIELNSGIGICYYKRGECYFKRGDLYEAKSDWEKAILLDENYRKELSRKIEKIKNKLI
ncbi:MAG: tetratricopeptide repeat protein [Ignavibacteria bacterium]|jgi:tetratricopeptide (TPR) repeat protein